MKYMYLSILLALFMNCSGQQGQQTSSQATNEKTKPLTFQMVAIPAIITEPEERAEYLAKHFWDHFDFSDLRYTEKPEVTEQAFADYINILSFVSPQSAISSLKDMMKKAESEKDMFTYFGELYEKYLYEPNSPMMNEEMFIPVLEIMVSSSVLSDVEKIRPSHLLEVALRNRMGDKATDFTYTLANGRTGTLYGVSSEWTILYFYNPDCSSCKEVTAKLLASPVVGAGFGSNKLKILAVYPDEDLTAWKEHIDQIPSLWINSYDAEVRLKEEEVYDLKAIPTLYLLDKEKKVVLKDTSVERIEAYLQTI